MTAAAHIAIIGAGPAGLISAETLARAGCAVTVFERMPSPARKFLMAGRGGLNLTHSEPLDTLLERYGKAPAALRDAIRAYPPQTLIAWCEDLGQPVFTGSSGRVFPKSFKASPLLRAWLRRLDELGVQIKLRHDWTGWDDQGRLTFKTTDGTESFAADATILALGGASWPKLGSDGGWAGLLRERGIAVSPFQPANCGLHIDWSPVFRERFAGQPLKSIALCHEGRSIPGELMITTTGLEGTPAYTVTATLRDRLPATIHLDLRPGVNLRAKLSAPRKRQSLSTFLSKSVGLAAPAVGLVQEIAHRVVAFDDSPAALDALLHALPLSVTGTAGLERAISTAGGIDFSGVNSHFMLSALPGVFTTGEMLDWEAPTGGYLLQGCFSSGVAAARGLLDWLTSQKGLTS